MYLNHEQSFIVKAKFTSYVLTPMGRKSWHQNKERFQGSLLSQGKCY
ncbi:hypothetical protein VCHA54P499_60053 [Vibrio chagasii]|nr:hypothetical protein VCHA39P226_250004 [Vibrio chagasii]CAH7182121.1 hypothetical protein VCHA52P456_230004 [Vibrio chagasii]CAH7187671.1 hypothetical protein VCHA52P453_260004 [Vibrio chagasii]CAH7361557.1 hypothetical protein VCHA57P527_230004 [Vibrio chagasii]CAH7366157.1 hypothetical protein VCHA54P499_60053 [Vibrio chagasii]